MQKEIILSSYEIRYETTSITQGYKTWDKELLESSEIASDHEVGLGLSEIGQFED